MRDLTKSFLSFSWTMSMFGLEQLTNVLSDERSGNRRERMADAFDAVTEATAGQLGKRTASLYEPAAGRLAATAAGEKSPAITHWVCRLGGSTDAMDAVPSCAVP